MSTKEAKAGLAQESPFADEKDGDPGLKFLKEINLTPSEEEELATLARRWIPGGVVFRSADSKAVRTVVADWNDFLSLSFGCSWKQEPFGTVLKERCTARGWSDSSSLG